MAAATAQKTYKVIEFYSGVSGMHYALLLSKIPSEVVAAVDINEVANKVYRYNFSDINLLQRNIQSVTLKDFTRWNADIFLMSPPCQPFTRVGLKGDKSDPRTSSFLYLLETLPKLTKKPRYLLVENVKGFETSDTRDELVDTLKMCNYKYKEFLLSPKDLGIPNQRLRYFLIAKQDSLKFHGDIQFNNGDTLLTYEISQEDNGHHSHDVGCAAGCMEQIKDPDSKLVDSTATGDSFHSINDCSFKNNSTPNERSYCHERDLVKHTKYSIESQKSKSFTDVSDLLCGSGSIKDYLENLSDEEFEDYLVPEKILVRFGKVMDIVRDSDERTCCFTKAYGHYVEGTGSFLQTNPEVTKHWAFENQEESEETISRLKQLCLRYFTPREVANFHHFPHDFSEVVVPTLLAKGYMCAVERRKGTVCGIPPCHLSSTEDSFPSDVSRKQQYRLLGNSLNACVVAVLLRYLVNFQDTT